MATSTKKPPKGAHPPSTPLEKGMVGLAKKFGLQRIEGTPAKKGKPSK